MSFKKKKKRRNLYLSGDLYNKTRAPQELTKMIPFITFFQETKSFFLNLLFLKFVLVSEQFFIRCS